MTDMEQQMIEQAKAGDPKAQYEMSLWARQMSILEPNQERWSRLAAKCLVDAAQAGYEPAQIMVQKLMSGESAEPAAEPEAPVAQTAETPTSRFFEDFGTEVPSAADSGVYDQAEEDDYEPDEQPETPAQPEQGFMAVVKKAGAALKKGGMVVVAAIGALNTTLRERSVKKPSRARKDEPEGAAQTAPARRSSGGKQTVLGAFNDWVEDNKRVAMIVGGTVAVVLVVLLVILLVTPTEEPEAEPTPVVAETIAPTPTPTPEPFPNEATKLEISSTPTLQYRPGDSDASYYLPASTSFTVQAEVETDDGENLRQGPNSYDYPEVIMRIPNGTKVTAYARYENDDGVVWYLINSGGTWGWMYGPSLG